MDKIEVFARARVPHSGEYYDQLAYDLTPGGFYQIQPNQSLPHITINSAGFRGPEWTGEEELLFLGDSVTFGVGADSDEHVLPRILAARGGVRVADASVRAYRIFQHYTRLPSYLEKLPKLKKVIVWGGYADLLYWAIRGGAIEGAFNFGVKFTPKSGLEKWAGRLAEKFGLVNSAGGNGSREKPSPVEDLADYVFSFLASIFDLAKSRGLDVIFLYQPFLAAPPFIDPGVIDAMEEVEVKTKKHTGIGWGEAASRFKFRLLTKAQAKEGLKVIDGGQFFNENDFLDQVHLKPASIDRFVTEILVEKIK